MNRIYLIGNIVRTPELTETSNGVKVCNFTLAVNRDCVGADGKRQTDFFDCTAWRGLAETVSKYVTKGNKLAVNGQMEFHTYEDSEGRKKTVPNVVVRDIEFLSAKNGEHEKEAVEKMQQEEDSDIPF